MTTQTSGLAGKSLDGPDETRSFPMGKVELVTIGGITLGRMTAQPGWRWSEHVKPIAGTESCQATHTGYVVSGRVHIRMDDGSERVFGPGDAYAIPPGHDGWVVGDEPYVGVDVTGMADFAKRA
jgi:quercetin dioxygenase-like cupin family protein